MVVKRWHETSVLALKEEHSRRHLQDRSSTQGPHSSLISPSPNKTNNSKTSSFCNLEKKLHSRCYNFSWNIVSPDTFTPDVNIPKDITSVFVENSNEFLSLNLRRKSEICCLFKDLFSFWISNPSVFYIS